MNYFAHRSAAERYAKARPYFHPLVMEKIAARYPSRLPFDKALDVGCGTGNSTKALLAVANNVTGTDISDEMLAFAEPHPRIRYLNAPAEALPFANARFGLITTSMAFHWFDQGKFLAEARRVVRADGLLVIYGHGFTGEMAGNPKFAEWNSEYLLRYPAPPRPPAFVEVPANSGFIEKEPERFQHQLELSPRTLAEYLLTQSNVINRVERGEAGLESTMDWILTSVTPLFPGPAARFHFHGHIRYFEPAQ